MRKIKKYLAMLALAAVLIETLLTHPKEISASTIPPEEKTYSPIVLTNITSQTDKVRVYVFDDTILKVQNESGEIFQKTYSSEGKKTITIPEQKGGTTLCFTLTTSYGKTGAAVVKKVKDDGIISNKKVNPALKKPKVSGKITDQSTSVKVYARKGDTLYIQNGASVLKKVKYKSTGYQTLKIIKQKAESKLTFYVTGKKGRSKYVTKVVEDVTAPKKPKIELQYEFFVSVKGEVGTDVYIKQNKKNGKDTKWLFMGTLTEKEEVFCIDLVGIHSAKVGDYFSVRLVDDAGNKSKIAKTEPTDGNVTWEFHPD